MHRRRFGILLFGVAAAFVGVAACGNSGQTSSSASSSAGGSGGSSASSSVSSGTGDTTSSSNSSSGTGGATASSSSSASSSSGAPVGHCKRGCAMPIDCCAPNQPNCPSNSYPTNPTCDQGVCVPPQCAFDADCNNGGPGTKVCKLVKGIMGCIQPCADDNGCSLPATCGGLSRDNTKFCAVVDPPCANDVDCGPGGKCQGTLCVCSDDSFCGGAGHCMAGDCVCSSDADCTAVLAKHCAF